MQALAEQRESWARAEALLDPACRAAVIERLEPWAQAHLAAKEDDVVAPPELPQELPPELRAAFATVAPTETYTDCQLAAWSVRAEALIRALLAMEPSRVAAEALCRTRAPMLFWSALQLHFTSADGARRAAWVAFLATPPVDLVTSLAAETQLAFEKAAMKWQRDRPFSLFAAGHHRSRPSWGPVATWECTRMWLLQYLSPEDWIRALDQLPLPNLMWDAVQILTLRDEPALIEHMLAMTPAAFDAAGAWTGSVAALLISDVVVEQLQATHGAARVAAASLEISVPATDERLVRAKQRLAALEHSEFHAWAIGVYASLLDRPGDEAVAFEIFARLCRTEILGEWNHRPGVWSAHETALAAMVRALVERDVPSAKIEAWWRRREADETRRRTAQGDVPDTSGTAELLFLDGLPYLIGATAVLHARFPNPREACGETAARLWAWTEELFRRRDPGIDLLESAQVQAGFDWLGYLLAAQRRPDEAWHALHRRLAPQGRRRAQVAFEPRGHNLHHSDSLGLIATLALVHWNQRASADEHPHIHAFFRALVEEARRMYLTAPLEDRRRSRVRLVDSFAPARAVFGQALDEPLAGMLAPLANDPVIIRNICEILTQNHVTEDELGRVSERLGVNLVNLRGLADRLSPRPAEVP